MRQFSGKTGNPVIPGCLALLGIFSLIAFCITTSQTPPVPQTPVPATGTIPGMSASPAAGTTTTRETGDYCYIQEVHPDFLRDSVIITLNSEDLAKFPEYGEIIMNSGNSSRKWINGRRTAGDFIDFGHRIDEFRNLSCRNMSYTECRARLSPVVYEYDGRYHEVACLPDFGGAHRTRDY